MAAQQGAFTYLLDPDQLIAATPTWWADLTTLGVSSVRVALPARADNVFPIAPYEQALKGAQAAGVKVMAVLDHDFNRPWLEGRPDRAMYPNEALGYAGNRRQNRWIKDSCVRAYRVCKQLGALIDSWVIYNEPNLLGSIAPGANVPPVAGEKAPAMSPEAFYSYACECAHWLRTAGARTVYVGSLSWIAGSGSDAANPYCAGYMRTGLAYLRGTGVRLLPWDGWCANMEGWWTRDAASRMLAALSEASAPSQLPLIVGEWGQKNGAGVDTAKAQETFTALSAIARALYFFSHPVRLPHATADYGTTDWVVVDGGFVPFNGRCGWYGVLQRLIQYQIPELTGYGSVMVHVDGADWLTENGRRFVPKDNQGGFGPMSGDLPLLDCTTAQLVMPGPCGPFAILRPGKPS